MNDPIKAWICKGGWGNFPCSVIIALWVYGSWWLVIWNKQIKAKAKETDLYTKAMLVGMIMKNGLKRYFGGKSAESISNEFHRRSREKHQNWIWMVEGISELEETSETTSTSSFSRLIIWCLKRMRSYPLAHKLLTVGLDITQCLNSLSSSDLHRNYAQISILQYKTTYSTLSSLCSLSPEFFTYSVLAKLNRLPKPRCVQWLSASRPLFILLSTGILCLFHDCLSMVLPVLQSTGPALPSLAIHLYSPHHPIPDRSNLSFLNSYKTVTPLICILLHVTLKLEKYIPSHNKLRDSQMKQT